MAGDWIKMRTDLWDHPKVACMVDATDSNEAAVVGACYWLWATADSHSEDGFMPGLTLRAIDRKTGVPGFAQALCEVGWLRDGADGVTLLGFEKHNGSSAKKRCQTARRVASHASANAAPAPENAKTNAPSVSSALPREEKRREEIEIPGAKAPSSTAEPPTPPSSPSGQGAGGDGLAGVDGGGVPALPPCPHRELLALYAQHLPMLPQPRPEMWAESKGAADLRTRWRWVLKAQKPDGVRYAESAAQALDWFSRFFAWVAASDFLTGQSKSGFACDLQWLVKRSNFEKVLQGNYKNKT